MDFVVKNWHLFAALVVIVALLLFEPLKRRAAGVQSVSALQLPQLLSHEHALVVDVSDEAEFKNGHIPNARNVPVATIADQLKKLEKYRDKPVVITCRTGNRSAKAASILKRHAFANLYTLAGGLAAWEKENLPIER